MAFGVTCSGAAQVVKAVRAVYDKTLIVKLSPNVTDIAQIACACEDEGADAVSLINTLLGMAVDIERRKPQLSIRTGGLSSAADAIEFLMCGATAIQIGTANFVDPTVTIKVIEGLDSWLDAHGCQSVYEIIGALEV